MKFNIVIPVEILLPFAFEHCAIRRLRNDVCCELRSISERFMYLNNKTSMVIPVLFVIESFYENNFVVCVAMNIYRSK